MLKSIRTSLTIDLSLLNFSKKADFKLKLMKLEDIIKDLNILFARQLPQAAAGSSFLFFFFYY